MHHHSNTARRAEPVLQCTHAFTGCRAPTSHFSSRTLPHFKTQPSHNMVRRQRINILHRATFLILVILSYTGEDRLILRNLKRIYKNGETQHTWNSEKKPLFKTYILYHKLCIVLLQGQQRELVFTISLYPRYRIRILFFCYFVELWLLLAYSESAPRLFNNL